MTNQMSGEKLSAQVVGNAFVQQYYQFLKDHPEYVHKFYNDTSVVHWPGPDGEMKSGTTTKEINDLIMSSDHNKDTIQIITADAQNTLTEGVLVVVTGLYISKENLIKSFSQTFVLARQEKAIFVMNDILRFVDVHESSTTPSGNDIERKASTIPSARDSGCSDVPNQPSENCISTQSEIVHDSSKNVPDQSNIQGVVAEVVARPPIPPTQLKPSVTKVASYIKDDISKMTYASMLARESPVGSPTHGTTHKIVRVAANADQQSAPAPALKAPSPCSDDTPIAQAATSNGVSKVSRPPSNGAMENNNVHEAAKGIYIKGLPFHVTKNGLLDIIKKFGRVKPDGIQIRKYEDGFCCGFVEFQNADSARNAVEAGKLEIEGKEAHMSYKRSSAKGSSGSGRYPSGRGGARNGGNFRGHPHQDDERRRRNEGSQYENRTNYAGGKSQEFGGRNTEYHHQRNSHKRDEKMASQDWLPNGRNGEAAYRRNN